MMNWMADGWNNGWWCGGGGLMGIFMLLGWVLIIVGVVFLVRWLIQQSQGSSRSSDSEDPLEILKRRYARGEISREEYERLRRDLLV